MQHAHDQRFRAEAMRAGLRLGWLSVLAVLVALALGSDAQRPEVLVALTLGAALAHAAMAAVPWARWLDSLRGRNLLDLWTGGLVGFVFALVVLAGARANFDLLLFLVGPFIAIVHEGERRLAWLGLAASAFAAAMALAPDPLPLSTVALHAVLLCAAVILALALAEATRHEATARADAAARAELERALLAESHHRVKNSLQTVADLLLLARPADGPSTRAFDDTATRIRSIAAVHHLLADRLGRAVDAGELLRSVARAAAADGVTVDADPLELDAAHAQQLGVVANELIVNAVEHGAAPIRVQLRGGDPVVLRVADAGAWPFQAPDGLGLQLVRRIAAHGLGGRFTIGAAEGGGTRAELSFSPDARPGR